MERENPPFQDGFTHRITTQDAFTHQIWNSYLKEYKRCAPDTIILKTRSEVKATVTRIWYVTFKEYKRCAPATIILKTWSDVKITITRIWYMTLRNPKMHLHTKFGILTSNSIGDMHQLKTVSRS